MKKETTQPERAPMIFCERNGDPITIINARGTQAKVDQKSADMAPPVPPPQVGRGN